MRALLAACLAVAPCGVPAKAPKATVLMVNPYGSENWSGYAFQGGPMTSISGTFIIPKPNIAGQCGQFMSQWVGIDGVTNQDLIQAGIAEQDSNPANGNCTPGKLWLNAWTEILPSAESPIPLKVHVGDTVTVNIFEATKGHWTVNIFDATTVRLFAQTFPYNGPASSGEWVVEAPLVGGFIAPLLNYGTAAFNGMHLDGRAALMDDFWLVPFGSIPGSVPQFLPDARTLMSEGFTVVYSSD